MITDRIRFHLGLSPLFMTPKRCFRLFVAKLTLFSVLSLWGLSFKLLCSKITAIFYLSHRKRFSACLPLNWAVFSLITAKKIGIKPVFSQSPQYSAQPWFSFFTAKSSCFSFLDRKRIFLLVYSCYTVLCLCALKRGFCISLANHTVFSFILLYTTVLFFGGKIEFVRHITILSGEFQVVKGVS